MTASFASGVLLALRDVFAAALPTDVPLSLGGPPGGDIPSKYAAVGYAGDNRPGVTTRHSMSASGATFTDERLTVWCAVSTASGDQDGAAQLAVTNVLFEAMAAALRADRQLGGLVLHPGYADLASQEVWIEDGGQVVTVFFAVEVVTMWQRR